MMGTSTSIADACHAEFHRRHPTRFGQIAPPLIDLLTRFVGLDDFDVIGDPRSRTCLCAATSSSHHASALGDRIDVADLALCSILFWYHEADQPPTHHVHCSRVPLQSTIDWADLPTTLRHQSAVPVSVLTHSESRLAKTRRVHRYQAQVSCACRCITLEA